MKNVIIYIKEASNFFNYYNDTVNDWTNFHETYLLYQIEHSKYLAWSQIQKNSF